MTTQTSNGTGTRGALVDWARRQAAEYSGAEPRPLRGYLSLMSVYAAGTLAATAIAKATGRKAPTRVSPYDLALLSISTHKLSRTISKDPVTSPIRAPFTKYDGVSAPSELSEQVRSEHGIGHSVGELLLCPMCLSQWVATAFTAGLVIAPTTTRMAMTVFTAVTGSDFMQYAYVRAQKATE